MNSIAFAVIVLVLLGLAGGVILVLASKFMAVYEDPRIAQVTECLAGANCGGCGYAGCADYAKAIVEQGAPTFKCAPGGQKSTDAINAIMGTQGGEQIPMRANVLCNGGENCGKRFEYRGIQTCAAAAAVAGGPTACTFGCLGLGDCTRACQFDAIHVSSTGVAVVDRAKCTGCSACTTACPRHIIEMKPLTKTPAVLCSNKEKGPAVMKACKTGCIACGMCVRNCPSQAVVLKDNVAVIDYTKCTGCGTCVAKCPKKVIHWVDGKPAVAEPTEA
ncbi:MAG: RnfABCDGE type electron transport complex subunit B [Gemmiger sp.]|uniref:RnfABCDGE type electron transport complex subunit B n=1 Tax=Gemmiger sp. TaxID=2049027 RepID=UPI002E79C026|nr:RnfABCDGE type electron transport complex subunit B [Gemmiger sp.]MEE0801039.1 RnfABCDGE type electron transport complex subunit B [Gemmiger sp.]